MLTAVELDNIKVKAMFEGSIRSEMIISLILDGVSAECIFKIFHIDVKSETPYSRVYELVQKVGDLDE